jgi:hypothetical protein
VAVTDFIMNLRMGKKIHLCEYETDELADALNSLFNRVVAIPRIRHGFKQTLDTLISEEALLLSKYLINDSEKWFPRIVSLTNDNHK